MSHLPLRGSWVASGNLLSLTIKMSKVAVVSSSNFTFVSSALKLCWIVLPLLYFWIRKLERKLFARFETVPSIGCQSILEVFSGLVCYTRRGFWACHQSRIHFCKLSLNCCCFKIPFVIFHSNFSHILKDTRLRFSDNLTQKKHYTTRIYELTNFCNVIFDSQIYLRARSFGINPE